MSLNDVLTEVFRGVAAALLGCILTLGMLLIARTGNLYGEILRLAPSPWERLVLLGIALVFTWAFWSLLYGGRVKKEVDPLDT